MVSAQTQHPTAQVPPNPPVPTRALPKTPADAGREPVPFIARLELGEQGRPPPLRLHDRARREVGSEIPGMMLVLQQRHVLQKQTQTSSSGQRELSSEHRTTQKTPLRYPSFEAPRHKAQRFALPKWFPVIPSPTLHWNGNSAPC